MADPIFPEATIGPLFYIVLGMLTALVFVLTAYIYRLKSSEEAGIDVKQLNMPGSRIKILNELVEEGVMQNELPEKTNLSKATVSQAIKELKNEGLVKRKKRGNTYLVEVERTVLEERCGRFN